MAGELLRFQLRASSATGSADPVTVNVKLYADQVYDLGNYVSPAANPSGDSTWANVVIDISGMYRTMGLNRVEIRRLGTAGPNDAYIRNLWVARGAGDDVRTTIKMLSNSHGNTLKLEAVFPDGSTYEVPGVNSGSTGVEVEVGTWELDEIRWRFQDLSFGGGEVWTELDTDHVRRTTASGVDWTGYIYYFDDAGTGSGPDGDFNDIIAEVRYYTILSIEDYGSFPLEYPYTADIADGVVGGVALLNDASSISGAAVARQGVSDYLIEDTANRADGIASVPYRSDSGLWVVPGPTSRWQVSSNRLVKLTGATTDPEGRHWLKAEYGDIPEVTIIADIWSPNPYGTAGVFWGLGPGNNPGGGCGVTVIPYESWLRVYGPSGQVWAAAFLPSWEDGLPHRLTIVYNKVTGATTVNWLGADRFVGTLPVVTGMELGIEADAVGNGFDYVSALGVGIARPFGHQYSMESLSVISQMPATWYFGNLTRPPLRAVQRNDQELNTGRHGPRNHPTSKQHSLRQGWRNTYL